MGLLSLSLFFGSILPLPATTPEAPLRRLLLTRPRGAMVSPDPHCSTCHTSSSTPTEWPRPRLSVERLRSEGTRSRPPALRGGRGRGRDPVWGRRAGDPAWERRTVAPRPLVWVRHRRAHRPYYHRSRFRLPPSVANLDPTPRQLDDVAPRMRKSP